MKHIKLFVFSFVLLAVAQGCEQNNKSTTTPKEQTVNLDTISPSSNIIIKVISNDAKLLKHLDVINFGYVVTSNRPIPDKETIGDTTTIKLSKVNQPQILEFFGFGEAANYNTRFLANPNDTILMTIKEGKISFSGKRAEDNNFFYELDPQSNQWSKNSYTNAADYKKNSHSIYLDRKQFFEDYIKERQVSENFKEQVAAELKFEYLYNLISPRFKESSKGIYINTTESVYSVIDQQEIIAERIIDANSYFGNFSITEFKHPELINNDYYTRALSQYIRHYFTGHEFLNYSLKNFEQETQYIEENLTGILRHFAITKMISDYYKNGFGKSELSFEALNNLIDKYKDEMANTSYVDALITIENKLKNLNTSLPQPILEEKLISIKGDTLSLNQILAANKDKIKVIDFWASWCKPCIEEIRKAQTFKQNLSTDKDVNWIFISIDHNVESWKSMSKELQEFGLMDNQYRIISHKESNILKILEINLIPRYIILGKTNKIISEKAPKPSDSLLFKRHLQ